MGIVITREGFRVSIFLYSDHVLSFVGVLRGLFVSSLSVSSRLSVRHLQMDILVAVTETIKPDKLRLFSSEPDLSF